jgi:hypothetical protein
MTANPYIYIAITGGIEYINGCLKIDQIDHGQLPKWQAIKSKNSKEQIKEKIQLEREDKIHLK